MKVLDMKFHDLNTDRVSFVYNFDEVFYIKNFVKRAFMQKNFDYC